VENLYNAPGPNRAFPSLRVPGFDSANVLAHVEHSHRRTFDGRPAGVTDLVIFAVDPTKTPAEEYESAVFCSRRPIMTVLGFELTGG
jgi:hypothetical protein